MNILAELRATTKPILCPLTQKTKSWSKVSSQSLLCLSQLHVWLSGRKQASDRVSVFQMTAWACAFTGLLFGRNHFRGTLHSKWLIGMGVDQNGDHARTVPREQDAHTISQYRKEGQDFYPSKRLGFKELLVCTGWEMFMLAGTSLSELSVFVLIYFIVFKTKLSKYNIRQNTFYVS